MPISRSAPKTMFQKIWDRHVVQERRDGQSLLYVDRHFLADDQPREVIDVLRRKKLKVWKPEANFAMADHYASTHSSRLADIVDDDRRALVQRLIDFTRDEGIEMFSLDDPRHGIIHVTGPEQGLSLPGMVIAVGDSHTSTHGALGTYALGIGAAEVSHVMATQTLWQQKPATLQLVISGVLSRGVTAKDLILGIIRKIGVSGATGHVVEYCGETINALSVEARMTLCNMSIEAGAKAGMIAPDDKTIAYLHGRPYAPTGEEWDEHVDVWRALATDDGACFDRIINFDASSLSPIVTWGTNPQECCGIDERIPQSAHLRDATQRARMVRSLEYMGLHEGGTIAGIEVDKVFIGSCTNGRIEDLRLAAQILEGNKVKVPTIVVPGSRAVREAAHVEGIDRVFTDAGCEWREPGCSMCLAINGDEGMAGERIVSTTNRNFIGRQGRGVRTHLVNPGMAAAAAVHGHIVDYRSAL
jgi:3-isopropylmalate/(R)-2-methylmalate dehydratase large subunit